MCARRVILTLAENKQKVLHVVAKIKCEFACENGILERLRCSKFISIQQHEFVSDICNAQRVGLLPHSSRAQASILSCVEFRVYSHLVLAFPL